MPDIKQLDYGLAIVDGHIVKVVKNAVDLSTDIGKEKLAELAAKMGTGLRGMPYGPCTVLYVYPEIDGRMGRHHVIELRSPRWLPLDARDMLKKEMPEYANEF